MYVTCCFIDFCLSSLLARNIHIQQVVVLCFFVQVTLPILWWCGSQLNWEEVCLGLVYGEPQVVVGVCMPGCMGTGTDFPWSLGL